MRADRLPRHRGPRRPERAGAPGLRRVDGLLRPAAGGEARRALRRCGDPAGLQRARQQEPRAHLRARYAARSARAVLHRPARRLGRALPALPGRGQGLRPERVAGASSGAPRGLHRVLPGPGAARPRPDAHLRAGARPARRPGSTARSTATSAPVRATCIPSPRASRCRASSARARTRISEASRSWRSTMRPAAFRCCSPTARGTTCARPRATSSSTSAT